ncbi:nucleolin-like [Pempheris klunzingeri]|uniref:nucleolin-like n=1 Tax=Pempheris klunzingeri TaxID=3127111 RepID=UPI0039813E0B
MAKILATRRRTQQSKVVTSAVVEEEEDNINTVASEGQPETDSLSEQSPMESTETKQEEDQNDQDSQMDTVIEVKGSSSTVTVSWSKNNEGGEADGTEERSNASDQMMDKEEQIVSSADAVAQNESTEKKKKNKKKKKRKKKKQQQEIQESGESQVDAAMEEREKKKEEANGGEQVTVTETEVSGKRKATSPAETSPAKKAKLVNDGFCVFVGNLNSSKTFDEVRDSLASYFMAQSLLVQDIKLDRSRKHAHVEMASEMDFTKALTLNGETVLEKPMKIAKAKIKDKDKVKVKVDKKAAKNVRCLFLKNVPYDATKTDILKVFPSGVAVRFPGGAESPNKGIAFVEFKNETIAKKVRQQKQPFEIQGRVLIVDTVGESKAPKDDNTSPKAAAPPNNILFVSNLPFNMKEIKLKKVFEKAVGITMPQSKSKGKGKPKGYAFVEFATVADAENALKTTQNIKISKREARVQFFEKREKSERPKGPSKTLMVVRLAEKTTAETLKSAFEGALAARVATDKETGASKRFGFVDFESEENSKAAKEAMEDCEIDGSKVIVAYAKPAGEKGAPGAKGGVEVRPAGKPAGRGAGKGGRGSRGGRGRGAVRPQAAVKEVENKG